MCESCERWVYNAIGEEFKRWLDGQHPDGMGNGFGGSYSQDDMEGAYRAGYHQWADEE